MEVVIASPESVKVVTRVLFPEFIKSGKEARSYLTKKIKNKECIIAVKNNGIVGILVYKRDHTHYANSIDYIIVLSKYRRIGIAAELLKKFIKISKKEQPKKQKYALSSTVITNKISIKMHRKFGFKKLGTIKRLHYGQDEIIFGYKIH